MHLLLKVLWFLVFVTITHQSNSTRILNDQSHSSHFTHQSITFFMQDVLCATYHSSKPKMTQVDSQLPFQKPVGLFFPPSEVIPLPESNPSVPFTDQTMDLSGLGLSFPTIATLKGLKFGLVTTIDEELIEGPLFGSALLGNAQGVYVANSDDGSSHMLAMTVKFVNSDPKDSLKFFGVRQTSLTESHIAVIGGTGKYHGANGYATVKALTMGPNNEYGDVKKFLLFTIYLSY
ncbi:hypothetical protein AQUCO_02700227v1 [Aquilegia coerulea]|uniref:Dirigent protein n=1 Tax=Aquilegia coerulea TaxID=218851 RepID=A0A2G5D5S8_AQUCA|nr:hypothetical protein AQUCO_02700227v1 [Aquilegia coerulea]